MKLVLSGDDCAIVEPRATRGAGSRGGFGPRLRHAVGRLAVLCIVLMAAAAPKAKATSLEDATERYRRFMISDIDQALAGARALRDRIDANDVAGAKKAWIEARVGWERSEGFTAGFIPDLDDAIDSWPDSVAGFHGIEAKLFGAERSDIAEETDTLILHLADLDVQVRDMPLTPQGLLNGLTRLAYEVGDSKVDGGESRFSGTSLDDMRNNVDGIALAYRTLFASALDAGDPKLAERVSGGITQLEAMLKVRDLKAIDPDRLRHASEMLVMTLQAVGPKIGLLTPTLDETTK